VLLRLDRLRDTMWSERIEAIVAPLPDYAAIVGAESGSFFDSFDALIMSSPEPRDVTATLVAAHVRGEAAAARGFLAHAAEIAWTTVETGTVGARPAEGLAHPKDTRVFFMPSDAWLVLSRPEHLAAPAVWFTGLESLEQSSGLEDGPVAVVSARGFRQRFRIPGVGLLPTPERVSATLTNAGHGFYVRGSVMFASEDEAARFVARVTAAQADVLDSFAGKGLLEAFGALNAAKGLRLRQLGNAVTFATSFSITDARTLLDMAAQWTARYYAARREEMETAQ